MFIPVSRVKKAFHGAIQFHTPLVWGSHITQRPKCLGIADRACGVASPIPTPLLSLMFLGVGLVCQLDWIKKYLQLWTFASACLWGRVSREK